jgi:hypothetical protein
MGDCNNSAGANNCPSCGQRVCQSNCTWSTCQSRVTGGCLDDHWECCGAGSGQWKWCNKDSCKYNGCEGCAGSSYCLDECG